MANHRPNILILMTDQQRADCMGCTGHPQIQTPHMDRLAAQGTHFTHACTTSPLCMPARASFISGLYVHNHAMWANRGELLPREPSLFRHLQQAGYRTGHIGKSHYYEHRGFHMREREDYLHARGFHFVHETTGPWATCRTDSYMTDLWRERGLLQAFRDDYARRRQHGPARSVWPSPLPTELFMDSYIGGQAVRFVEGYDREEPFALFVGFGGPHEPWDAPGDYATLYDPAHTPAPVRPAEPGQWVPRHAAEWQRSGRVEPMSDEDVQRLRANYYGKISLIDHWFGQILAACERRGLLDDLLVVFWSDHGEMAGDHGLLHKSRFFESALRVPLVLRWPGRIPAGQRSAALAETVDLMPTILEAVGVEAPDSCLGRSLWPAIREPQATVREAVLSEVARAGRRNLMVRTDRYKYAVHDDATPYMLYDLGEDPQERNNLLGHPDAEPLEADLRGRLLRRLCEAQFVRTAP
ncbi:MAG: sulfatase [Candidatus Brocadiia bacterium]